MNNQGGGIVSIDATVLRFLIDHPEQWGVVDIEHALNVPKATLSRSTDRLARLGLVEKLTDPHDKRLRLIRALVTECPLPKRRPRTAAAIVANDVA